MKWIYLRAENQSDAEIVPNIIFVMLTTCCSTNEDNLHILFTSYINVCFCPLFPFRSMILMISHLPLMLFLVNKEPQQLPARVSHTPPIITVRLLLIKVDV